MTENLPKHLPKFSTVNRKQRFKQNLRQLAKDAGFTQEELATELYLDADGRKWLGRLWNEGLDRPNAKTSKTLCHLSKMLGLSNERELWRATESRADILKQFNELYENGYVRPYLLEVLEQLAKLRELHIELADHNLYEQIEGKTEDIIRDLVDAGVFQDAYSNDEIIAVLKADYKKDSPPRSVEQILADVVGRRLP